MQLQFNGASVSVDENTTLFDFLSANQIADKTGIAVAINQAVIAKQNWQQIILKNNDQILVITATQGG